MALDDNKITSSDFIGKDISGLADNPALTAAQLKARFDAAAKEVIAPKVNSLIDDLDTTVAGLVDKATYDADADGKVDDAEDAETLDGKDSSDFVQKAGDTMTGALRIDGVQSSNPLKVSNIVGQNGTDGTVDDLYVGYGANKKTRFGTAGTYYISEDGSTFNGKATALRYVDTYSVTLDATHYAYNVSVSWATTDMWFESISTDYADIYQVRTYCATDGTVVVVLNKMPGSSYDGQTLHVKICGWK